jgi:hypothetical protein
MFDAITYKTLNHKFSCGDDFHGLSVVVFRGPNNAKAVAYCCNMNIDIDGDSQAYGRHDNPLKIPKDSLQDGGWLAKDDNAATKKTYEELKASIADLTAQVAALKPDATAAQRKDLDDQISKAQTKKNKLNPYPSTAKNYEKVFWHWYGMVALTPTEAGRLSFNERDKKKTHRTPELANKFADSADFEDVNGRFPVIQSVFEPGPGFFVSKLATPVNPMFPFWDQRYTLLPDATQVQEYAALSSYLMVSKHDPNNAAALELNHRVAGIRLDNGVSVKMPFLDSGFKPKVAECSLYSFTALGGQIGTVFPVANHVRNNFLVFYIAFPVKTDEAINATLAQFASAPNADQFPSMLAFVAKATVDATGRRMPGNGAITVNTDPMKEWEKWHKLPTEQQTPPASLNVINTFLAANGFSPFVQHMLKNHPSLTSGAPFLQPPNNP